MSACAYSAQSIPLGDGGVCSALRRCPRWARACSRGGPSTGMFIKSPLFSFAQSYTSRMSYHARRVAVRFPGKTRAVQLGNIGTTYSPYRYATRMRNIFMCSPVELLVCNDCSDGECCRYRKSDAVLAFRQKLYVHRYVSTSLSPHNYVST